jgi:hypothetical protein
MESRLCGKSKKSKKLAKSKEPNQTTTKTRILPKEKIQVANKAKAGTHKA